ncbi:MAG: hypothetical protein IJW18_02235 [Lachnospiraceae bacterium]|nr:hypothetical protein [Lachnospiraceae bacterium]
MRRTDEEFRKEVFERANETLARKRNTRNTIYKCVGTAAAVILVVLIGKGVPAIMSGAKSMAADSAAPNMECCPANGDGDIYNGGITGSASNGIVSSGIKDGASPNDETESISTPVEYEAKYVRIDGTGDIFSEIHGSGIEEANGYGKGIPMTIIDNKKALDIIVNELKENQSVWNSVDDVSGLYNEDFFEKNAVLLVYISEGSGSIRHEVTNVVLKGKDLYVYIDRIVPEVGTCDMAGWFVMVEVDKDILADNSFGSYAIFN